MNVSLMIVFKGLAKCVRYTAVSLSRVLFHIFCNYWGKENRSLYRGRSSLRGRRLKGKGKEVLGKGVLGARETRT